MIANDGKINTIINPSSAGNTLGYGQPDWSRLTVSILSFDSNKFYLGKLCKRQHRWSDSETSLRRKINNSCVECERYREAQHRLADPDWGKKKYARIRETSLRCNRRFHENNPDYRKQYNAEYRRKNRERILQQKREHYYENRERLLEGNRVRLRKFYLDNKDRIRQKIREKYYQNLGKSRQTGNLHRQKRRARKKSSHQVSYTPDQIKFLQQKFEYECAYCGVDTKLTLDHFIPISKGGSDCLGNLLPACGQCNSSKHDSDPIEWYKRQPFYSEKRWEKILKVLGKTETNYNQLPLF